jgi:plastocyanin
LNAFSQGIKMLAVISNLDAGGGSSSNPVNQFKPSMINITTNETLRWINPTSGNPYPHTITFISNTTDIFIPNMTINIDNQSMKRQQIIDLITSKVTDQNRSISNNINLYLKASVIESSEQKAEFLDRPSNFSRNSPEYVFNGTEKFVNSGLLWNSVKDIPSDYPKSFTVRFPVLGVYHFQCLIHPEMKGTVAVTPRTNMVH